MAASSCVVHASKRGQDAGSGSNFDKVTSMMTTETLFTADQVSSIYGLHRSKLYRALDKGWVKPDCVVGRAKCFSSSSLPAVLDQLSPVISLGEYVRAQQNLKLNGFVSPEPVHP